MTTQRTLLLLGFLLLLGGFAFMVYYQNASTPETSEDGKVKAKDPNEKFRQATLDRIIKAAESSGASKEFIARLRSPEYRNQIPVMTPEAYGMSQVEWDAFHKEHERGFEKWKADRNVDFEKGPVYDIEQHRAEAKRYSEEIRTFLENSRKRRERKIEYLESMGLILIFNEEGIPIDFKKDANGNPILRTQDASQTETEFQSTPADTFQSDDEPPASNSLGEPVNREPVPDEQPPNAFTPQLEISERIERATDTFSPDAFRDSFTLQVSTWTTEIDAQYLDVLLTPYLTQEEFEEFFPTEESRRVLQVRQAQMQADIAERVQNALSDDTPGTRREKLAIIQKTLSENWSEELADSIIEHLQ